MPLSKNRFLPFWLRVGMAPEVALVIIVTGDLNNDEHPRTLR
jgi:hypothetical protein